MEFKEIKDENGTHLQSYAETLAEKAKEAGLVTIMITEVTRAITSSSPWTTKPLRCSTTSSGS